ncbi:MAG: PD-(D/E)XK nuclease domain-containing protein [Deltaproteobacteria bacterium]|nr:PD-(D/E)XK nuclease domain-containing protein [Deltaproteobacteria bacterium]
MSLLFQTGYLTISKIIPAPNQTINDDGAKSADISYYYTLKVPNNEILYYYNKGLFKHLFQLLADSKQKNNCYNDIIRAITEKDSIKLTDILHAQLALIPYPPRAERTKKWKLEPELGEFHFQAVFLTFFDGLGLNIIPEAMSSQGRSDIDIILPNNVYAVLDLKYISDQSDTSQSSDKIAKDMEKMADKAIEQLKNSLQDKKYKNKASKIIVAGIVIYSSDILFVKFADKKTSSTM